MAMLGMVHKRRPLITLAGTVLPMSAKIPAVP